MTDDPRYDRTGHEVDTAQDRILLWVSALAVAAVVIGAVVYYNTAITHPQLASNEPAPITGITLPAPVPAPAAKQ